jgi:hypothetical protein
MYRDPEAEKEAREGGTWWTILFVVVVVAGVVAYWIL